MSHQPPPPVHPDDAALAAPPDAQNPALHDARKTFAGTLLLSALFIGAALYILL